MVHSDWIRALEDMTPIEKLPLTWDATGYTSAAFDREVASDSFAGWDGELSDEEEAAAIARLLNAGPGSSLLDVACGYGRHDVILAEKYALRVTGIDISAALIARAQRIARERNAAISFEVKHGRGLDWTRQFDHAIVANNSFSVFSPDDAPVVLRGVHRALKSGGRLFLDLDNKPQYCRYGTRYRNWYVSQGALTLQEVYFHYGVSVEVMRDIPIRDGGTAGDEFVCFKRIYSRDEICGLLTECGFRVDLVYGNWDFTPWSETSPKIVLVAVQE